VPHIYADPAIGTPLAINLRQSTSLLFVAFDEQSGSTDVVIDTAGVLEGVYTLNFESYNTLEDVGSALKTDSIMITVPESRPSRFTSELKSLVITPGVASSWLLP